MIFGGSGSQRFNESIGAEHRLHPIGSGAKMNTCENADIQELRSMPSSDTLISPARLWAGRLMSGLPASGDCCRSALYNQNRPKL